MPVDRIRKHALASGILGILLTAAPMMASQERPKPEQVLMHAKLEVVLPDFPAQGLILDIGGGEKASSASSRESRSWPSTSASASSRTLPASP